MFFKKVPSINYEDLPANAIVIDVREPFEFNVNKLPRTKNVPLSRINDFRSSNRIYVICASGARSKRAVRILRKNNIDAINIRGGILHAK